MSSHANDLSAAEHLLRHEHRGKRLLLVEDNRLNREVTAELLRGLGLVLELAENGVEAVSLAARNSFDVILMDTKMPKLDGLKATRAIRHLPGYGDVPIIALTGRALASDREACMAAGMNSYLLKPTPPDVLFAEVFKWLPKAKVAND